MISRDCSFADPGYVARIPEERYWLEVAAMGVWEGWWGRGWELWVVVSLLFQHVSISGKFGTRYCRIFERDLEKADWTFQLIDLDASESGKPLYERFGYKAQVTPDPASFAVAMVRPAKVKEGEL